MDITIKQLSLYSHGLAYSKLRVGTGGNCPSYYKILPLFARSLPILRWKRNFVYIVGIIENIAQDSSSDCASGCLFVESLLSGA